MLLEFARQPGDTLIADARDYITYSEKDFVPCKAERDLTEYTAGSKKTLTENNLNDIAIMIEDNSAIDYNCFLYYYHEHTRREI